MDECMDMELDGPKSGPDYQSGPKEEGPYAKLSGWVIWLTV